MCFRSSGSIPRPWSATSMTASPLRAAPLTPTRRSISRASPEYFMAVGQKVQNRLLNGVGIGPKFRNILLHGEVQLESLLSERKLHGSRSRIGNVFQSHWPQAVD